MRRGLWNSGSCNQQDGGLDIFSDPYNLWECLQNRTYETEIKQFQLSHSLDRGVKLRIPAPCSLSQIKM